MGRKTAHPESLCALAAALSAALALAGPASAQVLEIQADGAVTTFAGPAVYTDDVVRPLTPQAAPTPSAAPEAVDRAIRDSAERHAVSAPLVAAVAWQESRFNQAAVSPKGAQGIMQLMPATARRLGVDASTLSGNIEGGAAYLAQMLQRFEGDLPRALAAYNAGPEAVQRYGGVPPYAETQAYVRAIMARVATAGAHVALRAE